MVVPAHRLVTFARVQLDPGASQQIQLTFPTATLAVTPGDIESAQAPQVPPGDYTVEVPNQVRANNLLPQGGALTASFTLR